MCHNHFNIMKSAMPKLKKETLFMFGVESNQKLPVIKINLQYIHRLLSALYLHISNERLQQFKEEARKGPILQTLIK